MQESVGRRLMCPRCLTLPLVVTSAAAGLDVDSCTSCHGVWYDRGEMTAMFPVLRRNTIQPHQVDSLEVQQKTVLICPTCKPRTLRERPDARDPSVIVFECNLCGGAWLDKDVWAKLYRQRRTADAPMVAEKLKRGQGLQFSRATFDNIWINTLVPLVVLLLAVGLVWTGFDKLLIFTRIELHEIGHALPAWFSGRAALPLPIGITGYKEDPAWWTELCLAFLIGVFGYYSWREGRKVAVGIAVALFALQIYFTFILQPFKSLMFVTYGGIAGELLVSSFFIVLFHYPLPDRLRWDFWRFFFFVPAMVTFVAALTQWVGISQKVVEMPTMSMFGVPGDGNSDTEKLMNHFGWSADQIASVTVGIGLVCSIVLVVHYGYIVAHALFFSDDED